MSSTQNNHLIDRGTATALANGLEQFDGLRNEHDNYIERIGHSGYIEEKDLLGNVTSKEPKLEYINPAERHQLFAGYSGFGVAIDGLASEALDPTYVGFHIKLTEYFQSVVKPDIRRHIAAALPFPYIYQSLFEIYLFASSISMNKEEYYRDHVEERTLDRETGKYYIKPVSTAKDPIRCGGRDRLALIKTRLLDEIDKNGTIFIFPIMEGPLNTPETDASPELDSPEMGKWLGGISVLRTLQEDLEVREYELVAEAREMGLSWERIGTGLGLSRQAAHAKFTEKGYQTQMANNQKKMQANKARRIE